MPYQVQISAKLLSWPRNCACCGSESSTNVKTSASKSTGKKKVTTTTAWWNIPYCEPCAQHVKLDSDAEAWIGGGFFLGIALWVIVGYLSGSGQLGFGVGVLALIGCILGYASAKQSARSKMGENCSHVSVAVEYVEWHGTFQTFRFYRERYLEDFLALNNRKSRSDVERV